MVYSALFVKQNPMLCNIDTFLDLFLLSFAVFKNN